jgi:hypothetical protein
MSRTSSPSRKDRKGVKRTRLRSAQRGPTPWTLLTLWGYFGTITRRQYAAFHEADCPCCIEAARRRA